MSSETNLEVIIDSSETIDRISGLPDDLLLKILWAVITAGVIHAAARTCILSRLWRPLPASLTWLHITNLSLDAGDFFSLNGKQIAMPAFTSALRRMLTVPPTKRAIATLTIKFILTRHERDCHVRRICELVGDAVDTHRVARIELEIVGHIVIDTDRRLHLFDEAPIMVGYGQCFHDHLLPPAGSFRSALIKLSLENLWFRDPAVVSDLVRECNALRFLSLTFCGFLPEGALDIDQVPLPVLAIDAPQSQLSYLQCRQCYIDHVHLVQAPALLMFRCDYWSPPEDMPLPSPLDTLRRSSAYPCVTAIAIMIHDDNEEEDEDDDVDLKLSDVLVKGEQLLGLFLGIENGKSWVKPERPQLLRPALGRLDDLHVMGSLPNATAPGPFYSKLHRSWRILASIFGTTYARGEAYKHQNGDADLGWKPSPGFKHHHLKRFWFSRAFRVEKNLPFATGHGAGRKSEYCYYRCHSDLSGMQRRPA